MGFRQPVSTMPGHPAQPPFMAAPSGLGSAPVGFNPMMPTFPGLDGMPYQAAAPMANLGNTNSGSSSNTNSGMLSNTSSSNNLGTSANTNPGMFSNSNFSSSSNNNMPGPLAPTNHPGLSSNNNLDVFSNNNSLGSSLNNNFLDPLPPTNLLGHLPPTNPFGPLPPVNDTSLVSNMVSNNNNLVATSNNNPGLTSSNNVGLYLNNNNMSSGNVPRPLPSVNNLDLFSSSVPGPLPSFNNLDLFSNNNPGLSSNNNLGVTSNNNNPGLASNNNVGLYSNNNNNMSSGNVPLPLPSVNNLDLFSGNVPGPLPSVNNLDLFSNNNLGVSANNNLGNNNHGLYSGNSNLASSNMFGPLPSANNFGSLPSANLALQGQGRFGPPNMNVGSRNQGPPQVYPSFGLLNNNLNPNNSVGYGGSGVGTSLTGNTPRFHQPFPNPYAGQGLNPLLPTVPPVPSSPYVRSNTFDPNNPHAAFLRAQAGAGPFPGAAANNNRTMPYGQMGSTLGSATGTTSLTQLPNLRPTPPPAITGVPAIAPAHLAAAGPPAPAENNAASTNNPTVQNRSYRSRLASALALNNNPIVQQPPIVVPGPPTVSSHLDNNFIDPRLLNLSSSSHNLNRNSASNNNNSVVSALPAVSSSLNSSSATATGTQHPASSSTGPANSPPAVDPEFAFLNPTINFVRIPPTFFSDVPFLSAVKSEKQDEKLPEFLFLQDPKLVSQHSPAVKPSSHSPSEQPPAASAQPAIPTAPEKVPTDPTLQVAEMGMPIRTYPHSDDEAEASGANSTANVLANNQGANMDIDETGHSAADNNNLADDPHSAANNDPSEVPHSEIYYLLRELRVAAHYDGFPNQAPRFEDLAPNGHAAQIDPADEDAMIEALSTIAHVDLTSDIGSDATELAAVAAQRDTNSASDSGHAESDKENSAAASDETGAQVNGHDDGHEASDEASSSDDNDAAAPIPHQPRVAIADMYDPAANPIAGYWVPQPAASPFALPLSSAGVAFETDGFLPFAPWRVRDLVPFREETASRVLTTRARYLLALGQLYPDADFAVARHPASQSIAVRMSGRALVASLALHFPAGVYNLPRTDYELGPLYVVQLIRRDWPMGGVALLPDTPDSEMFVNAVQGTFDLLPEGREAFYFLPVTAPFTDAVTQDDRARGMLVCRAYEGVQGPQAEQLVVDWMVANAGGAVQQYNLGQEVLAFMGEAAVDTDRWPRHRRGRAARGSAGDRADAARESPAEEE